MITANEVLIYLKNRVKTVYCGGNSRQQSEFRDRWMPKLLSEVQADFPEIAHRLTCQTAEGCDFSGFSICVDNRPIFSVSTYSSTIEKAYYTAKWDYMFYLLKDYIDLETCSIDEVVNHRTAYSRAVLLKQYIQKIRSSVEELKKLDIDTTPFDKTIISVLENEDDLVKKYLEIKNVIKL